MKIKVLLLSTSLTLISILSFAQSSVSVKIKQDFETLTAKDHIFNLKKKPFKLVFHVKNLEGFCVGVTQDENIYRSAIGEADLEVEWFENTGMAEGLFNTDQSTVISDEAPSYWYFYSIDDHRFDNRPQGTQNEWVAERTISEFYISEFSENFIIADMIRPVYMVIYDKEYNVLEKKVLSKFKLMF